MDMGRLFKRPKIEVESVDANEAISFELASGGKCLCFKPEMCHQLFGDDETIVGHKNPFARVSIDHRTFEYRVEFTSDHQNSKASKVRKLRHWVSFLTVRLV